MKTAGLTLLFVSFLWMAYDKRKRFLVRMEARRECISLLKALCAAIGNYNRPLGESYARFVRDTNPRFLLPQSSGTPFCLCTVCQTLMMYVNDAERARIREISDGLGRSSTPEGEKALLEGEIQRLLLLFDQNEKAEDASVSLAVKLLPLAGAAVCLVLW